MGKFSKEENNKFIEELDSLKENEKFLLFNFDSEENFRTSLIHALFTFRKENNIDKIRNPRVFVDSDFKFK